MKKRMQWRGVGLQLSKLSIQLVNEKSKSLAYFFNAISELNKYILTL